jgi:hypothetical protein
MDAQAAGHRLMITLVHGTWARDATWTQRGSSLRTELSERLGEDVVFMPFIWSGRNSHRARLIAAKSLQEHILKLHHEFPRACHVVIAHSHGGNIALYALRNRDVAAAVAGLVTLATPFIVITARPLERPLRIVTAILGLFTYVNAMVVFLAMLRPAVAGLPTIRGLQAVIAALVFLLAGVWLTSAMWRLSQRLVAIPMDFIRHLSSSWQQREIGRLSANACDTIPMLSVSYSFDEAAVSLRLVGAFAESIPRLTQWLSATTVGLFMFGSALFLAAIPLGILGVGERYYQIVWTVTLVVFSLSLQAFIAALAASLVLPWIVRGQPLGFGLENPLSAIFLRMSTSAALSGTIIERRTYKLRDVRSTLRASTRVRRILTPGVIHSLAYDYPESLHDVAEWIGYVQRSGASVSAS